MPLDDETKAAIEAVSNVANEAKTATINQGQELMDLRAAHDDLKSVVGSISEDLGKAFTAIREITGSDKSDDEKLVAVRLRMDAIEQKVHGHVQGDVSVAHLIADATSE